MVKNCVVNLFLLGIVFSFLGSCSAAKKAGQLTRYCSYPPCCKSSGISYTAAEKKYCGQDECDDYSGCKYQGDFAFCKHMSHDEVVKTNIVSFFSSKESVNKYKNKKLRVTQNGKSIDVLVCDTCGDDDCDGCCTKNAKPSGYLLDFDANTYAKSGFKDGKVEWECINC